MKITVIGGGNVGTQFAVHAAAKGHDTTLYVSKPERFSNELSIVNEKDELLLVGSPTVTNDPALATKDADLIFVTHPAFLLEKLAKTITPYVKSGAVLCLVPGTGGGELAFRALLEKGCTVAGLQRIPSVARLVSYGRSVRATGYRDTLHLAALPHTAAASVAKTLSSLFDMPCEVLPNYLAVTLTPSNPILHTTRLYTLFRDYREGVSYERIPLFYEEWCDESSRLLFLCDAEVQALCRALDSFDLAAVRSLALHYESDTPEKLTRKIRSIIGFQGIATPSVKTEDGRYLPDLASRYFTADFPYGLAIFVEIGTLCKVDMQNCRKVLAWYSALCPDMPTFSYKAYGITDKKDLEAFYRQ